MKVWILDKNQKLDTSNKYLNLGNYAKYLKDWIRFFPLFQIHFVDGENFISEPWNEILKIEK